MTSAKNNSGITELFEAIAKKLLNLEIDENNDTSEYVFEDKSVLKFSKYLNYQIDFYKKKLSVNHFQQIL